MRVIDGGIVIARTLCVMLHPSSSGQIFGKELSHVLCCFLVKPFLDSLHDYCHHLMQFCLCGTARNLPRDYEQRR